MGKYLNIIEKYINANNLKENITWKHIKKKDGTNGLMPEKEMTYVVPSSFDIETSTTIIGTRDDGEPIYASNMYIWQFGIGFYPENYDVITGRTWEEFDELIKDIESLTVKEDGKKHYCFRIWVHNLSYEWQFIRKRLKWYKMRGHNMADGVDVFLIDSRKPVKARTENNIMFLDSYIMSGKSLEDLGNSLLKYKVRKAVGQLDYSLLRNSQTELTPEEMEYCINDVLVVIAYIREELESTRAKETITQLALTNTGRVRTKLKDSSFKDLVWRHHIEDYGEMTPKLYEVLSRAFSGGFTHSNPSACGLLFEDVTSMDFTSSYPTVMLSEKYPYGNPEYIPDSYLLSYRELLMEGKPFVCRFCIRNCELKNEVPDGIIPSSKMFAVNELETINGKLIKANSFEIYGTDIDLLSWLQFYNIESIIMEDLFIYPEYKPLPPQLQYQIADMYKKKTTLKGVEGKEREYMLIKGMLNSIYGMSVTRIMRSNIVYDGEQYYDNDLTDEEKCQVLQKYSEQVDRPTEYCWGVWITAYARANLFDGILHIGDDYIYSDTDSIKLKNYEQHKEYFENYNREIVEKLKENCYFAHMLNPTDIKGKTHQLGLWDYDGHYKYFKALRAKAYMYTDDNGEVHLTLAGCNKEYGTRYFSEMENPYEVFDYDCKIPPEYTHKLIPVDVDEETTWEVTDYQGHTEQVTELSYRSLKPVAYEMNEKTNEAFLRIVSAFRKDREALLSTSLDS